MPPTPNVSKMSASFVSSHVFLFLSLFSCLFISLSLLACLSHSITLRPVTSCGLVGAYELLEDDIVSLFRDEDDVSMFLRNAGYSPES